MNKLFILVLTLAPVILSAQSPPVANAGKDQIIGDTQDYGFVEVRLYGYNSKGNIVSYVWTLDGDTIDTGMYAHANIPVGINHVVLTVTDDVGLSDKDTAIISVYAYDDLPIPVPGSYSSVTDTDNSGNETIHVDGSASWDRGGNAITQYRWLEDNDNDKVLGTGVEADITLGIGTTPVYLEVTNSLGVVMSEKTYISVEPSTTAKKVYYVQSPDDNANASDSNAGTDINYPWATWKKAFNTARAGDTVYFRGGTWYMDPSKDNIQYIPENGIGHNGTYNNHIVYTNYPGEIPIADYSKGLSTSGSTAALNMVGVSYIEVKGLIWQNFKQNAEVEDQWINILGFTHGGNIWVENCIIRHTGGAAFRFYGYDTVHVKNCDAYDNIDDKTLAPRTAGHADGFIISSKGTAADSFKVAYVEGCRAWYNSDDGFDVGASKQVYISNCWSFNNGRGMKGDGNGFKFSLSTVPLSQRIIRNCITAYSVKDPENNDPTCGGLTTVNLYDTVYGPQMTYLNISMYRDYMGYRSSDSYHDCTKHPDAAKEYFANCIIYDQKDKYPAGFNACDYSQGDPSYVTIDSSSFQLVGIYGHTGPNPSYTVTDDDFVSLDTAELSRPRKADGSLPDINFMKLAPGSDLIDRGIDVGLPYNGAAPDLGWCEYGEESSNSAPVIKITSPVYGATFNEKDTSILIKTEASDIDGTISKVIFYSNNTKIGESTAEPWSFTWENVPFGSFALRATAIDNEDAQGTSATVNITKKETILFELVEASPDPTVDLFEIKFNNPASGNIHAEVFNDANRKVMEDNFNVEKGLNKSIVLNLSSLDPGNYKITVDNGKDTKLTITVTRQAFINE